MLLVVLLSISAKHKSDAVSRFDAYMAAHPRLMVSMVTKVNDKPGPTGSLIIDRPDHSFLYKESYNGADFSVSSTSKGYVEIDRQSKLYEEYPPLDVLQIFESEINGTGTFVAPRQLFSPTLEKNFPRGSKIVDPNDSNKIHFALKTAVGDLDITGTVDSDGRLIDWIRSVNGQTKNKVEWLFSDYKDLGGNLPPLGTPLPAGFTPYSVPRLLEPLQKGSPAPVSGWASPTGARNVDFSKLAQSRPFVIAFVGDQEGPAGAALPIIKDLGSKIPTFIVGKGFYSDPSGALERQLNAPGSPMFYLVDSSNKIAGLWLGFDPAAAQSFVDDVVTTASTKSAAGAATAVHKG